MLVLIMGVAGSGKTTVGTQLAAALRWSFVDADDCHSTESISKMSAGIPLTDEDRRPWLEKLRGIISDSAKSKGSLVLACSALKKSYRDTLLSADSQSRVVYLKTDLNTARERLLNRKGHYMPADLLPSQFAALEEPTDSIVVPADLPPDQVVAAIRSALTV